MIFSFATWKFSKVLNAIFHLPMSPLNLKLWSTLSRLYTRTHTHPLPNLKPDTTPPPHPHPPTPTPTMHSRLSPNISWEREGSGNFQGALILGHILSWVKPHWQQELWMYWGPPPQASLGVRHGTVHPAVQFIQRCWRLKFQNKT